MAALTTLFLALLQSGDRVVCSDVVYGGTYRCLTEVLGNLWVTITFVDTADLAQTRGALQRPLDLGADVTVYSTTKFIDGHNATVGGTICTRSQELRDRFSYLRKCLGTIQTAQNAFLTLQGLKTLPLRLRQQTAGGGQHSRCPQALHSRPRLPWHWPGWALSAWAFGAGPDGVKSPDRR